MKITIRPGHGITPPAPLCYTRAVGQHVWHRQRPGGYPWPGKTIERWYEDDWTASFCAALVPVLEAAGHFVRCQRALPGTSAGDAEISVGRDVLPQLPSEAPTWTGPRWQLCASVEGVLRGLVDPQDPCRWSWDPQMSCLWERSSPLDLYLSIHVNWYDSPKMYGIGAFAFDSSKYGGVVAENLLSGIKAELAAEGGDLAAWALKGAIPWGTEAAFEARAQGERWGVYRSTIWELAETRAPAVILELGFASHVPTVGPSDLERITSPQGKAAIIRGIVRGLASAEHR